MTGRTSARSSAKRDQASSPPKPSAGRAYRTTRSASRELGGESDTAGTRNRGSRRGARAESVDSIKSQSSNASSRAGRTRKATRSAIADRDLSMVAESREQEEEQEEEEEDDDDGAEEIDSNKAQRSQSPMSQVSGISGTTAITTHSTGLVADLDPMMAEILPELYESSYKIMRLLAPGGVNEEIVDSVVNELKTPGSRRSKLLRLEEDRFKLNRDLYGNLGDDRNYINSSTVLRKLLGENPGEGRFRPDAIIHAANLAILVKMFAVTPRDGSGMKKPLSDLSTHFPEPFVSRFDDDVKRGGSTLLDEAFDLGLDIRTQWTIYYLRIYKGQDKGKPEEALAVEFFHPPAERDEQLPLYEDYLRNGYAKDIFRSGPTNSDGQVNKIVERVNQIYAAFNRSEEAVEQDDLVDFERLEELFGWANFLARLVIWSRSRANEIRRSIEQEGGIQTITKALIEEMKCKDSQINVAYDEPPTVMKHRELLPPANIMPGVAGKSLYGGIETIRRLKRLRKRDSGFSNTSASNQKAIAGPSSSLPKEPGPRKRATVNANAPLQHTDDDYRPLDADDSIDPAPRPSMEYVEYAKNKSNEHNKENRPLDLDANPPRKQRLVDPQSNAVRMEWNNSQDPHEAPLNRKHAREDRQESEESEDGGFEQDRRVPNPARRNAASAPSREFSPKRQRVDSTPLEDDEYEEYEEGDEESAAARESREQAGERLQASARGSQLRRPAAATHAMEEDEDDDEPPRPTFLSITVNAKQNAQIIKMETAEPQRRIKWSENDTERLRYLIEKYGCSWAFIEKRGGFDVDRGQVALKDKARNMKVAYLKAGVRLSPNFEKVRLGAKEVKAVQANYPDYEQ